MGTLTVLCSIGTTHPWNIAGVGLDARVAARLGARHVEVIAGVSAQGKGNENGNGIATRAPIPAETIAAQLRAAAGAGIDAYRVGALLSPESVATVAAALAQTTIPVVCDPVIATSKGLVLADDATVAAFGSLFRVCTLVTPNIAEASRFCGFPVNDRATMAGAAHTLVERDGARAALITGGDLQGDPIDVLYADGRTTTFEGSRLSGGMRGTGCVLAAATAIYLGRGANLVDAVDAARALVRDAITHATDWNGERVWPFP